MPTAPPVNLAGSTLRDFRHICAFFNSRDEEYRALMPFIREGFEEATADVEAVQQEGRPRHRSR